MILPHVINEEHDNLVRRYLYSKQTHISSKLIKQQWLLKSDGTVTPVQLTI
jgi:hypothetical protein